MQSALQNKNWCSAVQCSESDCPCLRFNVSSIDFVRVTNCFYDYDYYDYKVKQQKDVFSRRVKMPSVSDAVTLGGTLFQSPDAQSSDEEGPVTNLRTTR